MKRVSILLVALACATAAVAQRYERSNLLGMTVGGGVHTLLCNPSDGSFTPGYGYEGGLQYAHFFGRHFGLALGVHYSFATSTLRYDFTETYAGDAIGYYELSSTFSGWRERQEVGFVSVPLELLWRQSLGGRWSLFFGVGAQVDWNLHGRYVADGGRCMSTLDYTNESGVWTTVTGFDHDASASALEGDVERLPLGVSALADLGVRVALSECCGLYLGVYGSYGLLDLAGEHQRPLVDIGAEDPTQCMYGGSYHSRQVDAMRLFSAGVKLGFDFGWGRKKGHRHSDRGGGMVGYEVDPAESMERYRQRPPVVRKEEPVAPRQTKDEVRRLLDLIGATVYFESSGVTLAVDPQTYEVLRALCEAMREDPTLRVTVAGHTDNTGSVEINMEYGMRRAEALKAYLVGLGAPSDNIDCESRGKNQPVASNDTEEGRARNRRATVTLQ